MASLLKSRRTWVLAVFVLLVLVAVWHLTAYHRGMLMARLLEEKYGVRWNRVAGCVVSVPLGWYAEGCDATCKRLLAEKYGKDVIKECFDLA